MNGIKVSFENILNCQFELKSCPLARLQKREHLLSTMKINPLFYFTRNGFTTDSFYDLNREKIAQKKRIFTRIFHFSRESLEKFFFLEKKFLVKNEIKKVVEQIPDIW